MTIMLWLVVANSMMVLLTYFIDVLAKHSHSELYSTDYQLYSNEGNKVKAALDKVNKNQYWCNHETHDSKQETGSGVETLTFTCSTCAWSSHRCNRTPCTCARIEC